MNNRITKITVAAVAVFVVGLLLLVGDGQQTLCAQALKAIGQARTLHVTTKEYHHGQHVKDHEVWYDRRAGVMEQERYENRTDVRIDNGMYEWRYAKGGAYVGRQKSYRDNDEWMMELCVGWRDFDPRRAPTGDTCIAGLPCKLYVLSDSGCSYSVWVDGESRVRRVEQTQKSPPEEGEPRLSMEIEYDVRIDPQRFEPPSEPEANIIDPRQLIEQQYPLDTALFTRETLGFTFAVHRLELCREGSKFLVCSHRLTDETRQQIDAPHPWAFYGSADLREIPGNWSCDRVEPLACMSNEGICISWYLLLPAGGKGAEAAGCDVNVQVSTANQLEKKLKMDGSPTREVFRLVIPKEKSRRASAPLTDLLRDLFTLGEQLDPVVHSFLLTEVLRDSPVRVWRRPGIQLSKEQYLGNVEQRMEDRSQHQ